MNKFTSISHPDVPILGLDAPSGTRIAHKPPRRMKNPPKLDGLREYSHLSGGIARRKEQLKRMRKPHQPSGDRHYMVRRKKKRALRVSNDRYAYRDWRKDYKLSHGVKPDVTYEEWWYVMRGTVYPEVPEKRNSKGHRPKSQRVYLMPYDESDHTIDNMYVSYQEWGLGFGRRVFLADASLVLAEKVLDSISVT